MVDTVDANINHAKILEHKDKYSAMVDSQEGQSFIQTKINNIIKYANERGFILNMDKCRIP